MTVNFSSLKQAAAKFSFFAALALTGTAALAGVELQYTGHDFNSVGGPFTTNDSVDITLVLAAAPPPNTAGHYTAVSYLVTDGVDTLTQATPTVEASFFLATDSNGQVLQWNVAFETGGTSPIKIYTLNQNGVAEDFGFSFGPPEGDGLLLAAPGKWTVSAIPEPETFVLMLTGIAAVGLTASRRRLY